MPDENSASMQLRLVVAAGVVLGVIGAIWLLWLAVKDQGATSVASAARATPSAVVAPPAPTSRPRLAIERSPKMVAEPILFDDDMGAGTTEFSAVALNEATNRLMVADDEGRLFEFELDASGVPEVPPRRTIIVEVDDSDIEGLAWISGDTYVMAHETTGRLLIVEIGEEDLVVGAPNVRRTIDTQVPEVDGNGIEGVSHVETIDDVEFIVAIERPPSLTFIDDDGELDRTVPLQLGLEDVADVWASPDGTFWIVSDMARVVVRVEIDADGVANQLQQIDLAFAQGRFEQPEGIVISRDGARLYVVGEAPGPGQFSFGFWSLS